MCGLRVSPDHLFHVKHSGFEPGDVSRETRDRLQTYAALLVRWNRSINLIGRHTVDDLWQRHFADCLQLGPLIPSTARSGVDLGSGAGFPGLVLAIATGIPFHLIESDVRKAAFLRVVIEATGAPSTVHAVRLEAALIPPADVVTSRALAPLPKLMPGIARFLSPDGVALLLKGEHVDEELTGALSEWHMTVDRRASVTDSRGVILRLTEVRRA
jgi:16S rRNA (guanine527-N7)-methyltransferase